MQPPDQTLDARGLKCPMPILKARKALNGMQPGQRLEVLATDPGSVRDFQAFCRATGDALLEHTVEGVVFRFLLEKAG
ncbi:MAG: sulfurtransferase TusA family protein [Steroidobacteraceae bacterium]|jgi:tRNA 2-thiouridine synthesizing protein A